MTRTEGAAHIPRGDVGTQVLEVSPRTPTETQERTGDRGGDAFTGKSTHRVLSRVGVHTTG